MPAICINDLREAIPRNYGTNIYSNPFRYPQMRTCGCRTEHRDLRPPRSAAGVWDRVDQNGLRRLPRNVRVQ
jgi:hypothetical protein